MPSPSAPITYTSRSGSDAFRGTLEQNTIYHVIVQATRLSDGSRKITSIHEVTGMEGEVISTQEIFHFERSGVGADGAVLGRFKPTGIRPLLAERLKISGVNLAEELFNPLVFNE